MTTKKCSAGRPQRDIAFRQHPGGEYFAKAVLLLIDNRQLAKALRKIAKETKQPQDPQPNDDCSRCGAFTHTDDGLEPTGFCHPCAQAVAVEVRAIALAALKRPTWKAKRK